MAITEQDVLNALSRVIEPELHRDLVSLNMVKDVQVRGNDVSFKIELTTPACPLKDVMEKAARAELSKIPGIGKVEIGWTSNVAANARMRSALNLPIKNVIAVASGKGGVGKSTIAVNIAIALGQTGAKVGLLDNDVYGPNVPLMVGLPMAELLPDGRTAPTVAQRNGRLIPEEKFGIKIFSIGFIYPAEAPLVWRGPMLHSAIRQFLQDVEWGDLDYLIVDMPPGTGDSQLSLAQTAQGVMGIIVTTPQLVSMGDALKGLAAFEQLKVPIIGVIENMGPYTDPKTGQRVALFGEGGGERLAALKQVPFLGSVPLDPAIRIGGDSGRPVVVAFPESEAARALREIAGKVAARVSVLNFQQSNVIPISIIG
ncbi:MAG: Mrp/NBP35 family ATP-binding protein [Anaerolineae bacterium]|nr:Mrp/NBP35 family ATP-binding protein [Anaerolineae bacterium]